MSIANSLDERGDFSVPSLERETRARMNLAPTILRGNGTLWGWRGMLALFLMMVCTVGFSIHSTRASAISRAPGNRLTMQVDGGFGTYFRSGAWVPLYITLHNTGPDFSGMLSSNNPAGFVWQDTYSVVPSSAYQQSVTVPQGTQKQVILYLTAPAQFNTVNISVQLLDSYGKLVQSQSVLLHQLFSEDVFVGLLSDQTNGFNALSNVALPSSSSSVLVQHLNAQNMPSMAAVLANFDVVVLDSFHTGSLTHEQLRALYLWVQQGGSLIEVGGLHLQQTMSTLPANLLPVIIHGTTMLPEGTHLLPAGSSLRDGPGNSTSDTLKVPIPVSNASVLSGARTIVSAGGVPLLVQAQSRQGLIYYLAYDPALEPMVAWPGTAALWRGLIIRSLGAQLLPANFSQDLSAGIPFYLAKLQHLLLSNPAPSPWLLFFFFIGYLIILGPVRWIIVRRTKQRQWSLRIILGSIVIFSLLNFAVAFHQEQSAIFSNSFSLIQLASGSSVAHSTTYHGVYVPFMSDMSTVRVKFPAGNLVQPFVSSDQQLGKTSITANSDGTQVQESASTFRSVDALQAEQDISIQGGIVSHLKLGQETLSGTVTNTLATGLSDVYLLMPHSIQRVGNLAAGQTSRVTLALAASSTNGGLTSCASLVKQVVNNDAVISTGFDHLFVRNIAQSLSERQRHLSLLAFMLTASQCSNPPLEGAGSSATLIGWADQPLAGENSVTINGIHPGGIHETAIVADLEITYAAGSQTLPADVLPGQLVNTMALGARLPSPGAYALSRGQITFEFNIPSTEHLHIQTLTLSQPVDASVLPVNQPGGQHGSASYVALYNWQTNSWNSIHLTQSNPFTTGNAQAYVSRDGRVLIQYVNHSKDFSDIAFTMPALTVSGNISSS